MDERHAAVHPSARANALMAYDAATGTVVLFAGLDRDKFVPKFGQTWIWG
jgi:hypothetical protein